MPLSTHRLNSSLRCSGVRRLRELTQTQMPTHWRREESTRSFSSSAGQRLQKPSRMLYSNPSLAASSLQSFISFAVVRGREAGDVDVVVVEVEGPPSGATGGEPASAGGVACASCVA